MTAYAIADVRLIQPDVYKEYQRRAKTPLDKFGAEVLAYRGNMSVKEDMLWSPNRLVLIQFPSMEHAEAFYACPEYQDLLGISRRSSERTLVLLDGK